MKAALEAAIRGVAEGENPFGAAIIDGHGALLSAEHNQAKSRNDPSAHAEVLAIATACNKIGKNSLPDCWLAATCEPCPMCAANAAMTGIRHVVFGANESTVRAAGFTTLQLRLAEFARIIDFDFEICPGVLEDDCSALLLNHPQEE